MEAIDFEICRVFEEEFVIFNPTELTEGDMKNRQLNAQACDILFNSLSDEQFGRISSLRSVNQIWETIHEVDEAT